MASVGFLAESTDVTKLERHRTHKLSMKLILKAHTHIYAFLNNPPHRSPHGQLGSCHMVHKTMHANETKKPLSAHSSQLLP